MIDEIQDKQRLANNKKSYNLTSVLWRKKTLQTLFSSFIYGYNEILPFNNPTSVFIVFLNSKKFSIIQCETNIFDFHRLYSHSFSCFGNLTNSNSCTCWTGYFGSFVVFQLRSLYLPTLGKRKYEWGITSEKGRRPWNDSYKQ